MQSLIFILIDVVLNIKNSIEVREANLRFYRLPPACRNTSTPAGNNPAATPTQVPVSANGQKFYFV